MTTAYSLLRLINDLMHLSDIKARSVAFTGFRAGPGVSSRCGKVHHVSAQIGELVKSANYQVKTVTRPIDRHSIARLFSPYLGYLECGLTLSRVTYSHESKREKGFIVSDSMGTLYVTKTKQAAIDLMTQWLINSKHSDVSAMRNQLLIRMSLNL